MAGNGQHNPPPIRATLLGQTRIHVGDRPIGDDAWALRSARSLLLLLLITPGHAMAKERVRDLLWPEASLDVGRNALYKALHHLRRVLEPDLVAARQSAYIVTRGATVGIAPTIAVEVDTDAFEGALREASHAETEARRPHLRAAVDRYGGELLPTERYEDWPIGRREMLQRLWEDAVLDLAALDLEAGEPQASVPALERLLATDPLIEEAHRALMRGYLAAGQRDRALRQYERCAAALASELGLEPDEDTKALLAVIQAVPAGPGVTRLPDARPFLNLPRPPTPIVGRDREVDLLHGTLWRQDIRLVTLTGPGGVGKTRLALEVAGGLVEDFADGIAFVELATVRDPRLVLQTIALALGLAETPDTPIGETLTAHLRDREMLLVLDNLEHVLDAAAEIGALLASCPALTVLCTSRERLHLRGEHMHEVQPLGVPHPDRLPAPATLSRYGSVALFTQHMRRIDPRFEVSLDNSEVVSRICRHLEGLPLAIELATAHARWFSLEGLLDRIASRLDLETGPRDLPARQRTLRATFAWSHDLLTPDERAVFRRLGVITGGCLLDAAEALNPDLGSCVRNHLRALAEKHLVGWEETDDGPRITMLETIREYALEHLRASGEEAAVRARHAGHYLDLALRSERRLVGTEQPWWMARLTIEQGNIRAALDWALGQRGDTGALAMRAVAVLWRFWLRRRSLREGIRWLERAAARPGTAPQLHARVLVALARLHEARSDYDRAEALIGEALPVSDRHGDLPSVAEAWTVLGEIAEDRADFDRATTMHERALRTYRDAGLRRESASALNKLATVAYYRGDFPAATRLWEQSMAVYRELGDLWSIGVLLGNLGAAALALEDLDRAVGLYEENLAIARLLDDQGSIGRELCNLAEARQLRGDGDQRALLEEALAILQDTQDRQSEITSLTLMGNDALAGSEPMAAARHYADALALCERTGDRIALTNAAIIEHVAALGAAAGHHAAAARLLGGSERLRDELGTPLMPYHRAGVDGVLEVLRAALPASALAAEIATGRDWDVPATLHAAQSLCEHVITHAESSRSRPPAPSNTPTP